MAEPIPTTRDGPLDAFLPGEILAGPEELFAPEHEFGVQQRPRRHLELVR